jgi:O-acetyl-ADP-ribose deacetylase (regulator of RNase III)
MNKLSIGSCTITLTRGDITEQEVDGIVNAANSTLLGGGGVDGAIHRRGGPAILEECRRLRRERYPDGLPAGQAVSTTAGLLPARRVIHTVGPIWHGGDAGEAALLASAYETSLACAVEDSLETVAFPSISTGAYGYPMDRAARVALAAVIDFLRDAASSIREVRFVLFAEAHQAVWAEALAELAGVRKAT